MFMGPTWGLSGADRTQMDPMLAPWTLLSRVIFFLFNNESLDERMILQFHKDFLLAAIYWNEPNKYMLGIWLQIQANGVLIIRIITGFMFFFHVSWMFFIHVQVT